MRSFWVVARNTLMIELEYRISYFILIFSNLISLGIEFAVLGSMFEGQEKIGSLTKDLVVPFIILGTIIRSASALWSLVSDSIDTIREGSFQKFLLAPIHYPSYFFAQALGGKGFTLIVLVITVLAFKFGFGFTDFLNVTVLPEFLVALFIGTFVTWQVYLTMVYLGFWIEEASFLSTAFNISVGVFSGTLIPLDWIPNVFLVPLKFSPYPLMGDFPMRAGLGTLGNGEFQSYLATGLCWMLALAALNALLWNWGTRRYEAFGG